MLISATLNLCGCSIAGTQHDFTFATAENRNVTVVRKANGRPDCTVNPDINKGSTTFAFQPPSCTEATCTAVRAIVFSSEDVEPIADGATLYTCKVQVAADAPDGVYPLTSRSGLVGACPTLGDPSCTGDRNGSVTVRTPCVGTCTGGATVSVDDLVLMVNIVLGYAPVSLCPNGDAGRKGAIGIDDIIEALNNALDGCPPTIFPDADGHLRARTQVGALASPAGGPWSRSWIR